MGQKFPLHDVGKLVEKVVRDAIDSSHVEELRDLGDIVFGKPSDKKEPGVGKKAPDYRGKPYGRSGKAPRWENAPGGYKVCEPEQSEPPPDEPARQSTPPPAPKEKPNTELSKRVTHRVPRFNLTAFLLVVLGITLTGIFAGMAIIIALSAAITNLTIGVLPSMAVLLPLTAASLFATIHGFSLFDRTRRARRYEKLFSGRKFYFLDELSAAMSLPAKTVIKDLNRMIKSGFLPDGHLDAQNTCLMLDSTTYKQYLRADEEVRRLKVQQKARVGSGNDELDKTIASGQEYINRIREANRLIPGEAVSRKLSHMDDVTGQIFDCVARRPEKLPELRRFMNYYLPTTLKLLDAYVRFESQSIQNESIISAKREIESALSKINIAFEKLLESLFHDDVMDITTDISALETMLAQEGLTDDFGRSSGAANLKI